MGYEQFKILTPEDAKVGDIYLVPWGWGYNFIRPAIITEVRTKGKHKGFAYGIANRGGCGNCSFDDNIEGIIIKAQGSELEFYVNKGFLEDMKEWKKIK